LPKPTRGARLGSGPTHQRLLLSGLAAALFRDERIRTTEAKAKRLRPVAEKLITLGKSGDVSSRRQALSMVEDRDVIHKLFADIAPRYSTRNGGYVRILKLGPRKGDAAPMALIELVEGELVEEKKTTPAADEGRRRGLRRRRRTEETPAAEVPEDLDESEAETPAEDEEPESETEQPVSEETPEEPPEQAAEALEEKVQAEDASAQAISDEAREAQPGPPTGSDKDR
jgi:large subunit ribosomal protein L17